MNRRQFLQGVAQALGVAWLLPQVQVAAQPAVPATLQDAALHETLVLFKPDDTPLLRLIGNSAVSKQTMREILFTPWPEDELISPEEYLGRLLEGPSYTQIYPAQEGNGDGKADE